MKNKLGHLVPDVRRMRTLTNGRYQVRPALPAVVTPPAAPPVAAPPATPPVAPPTSSAPATPLTSNASSSYAAQTHFDAMYNAVFFSS